MLTRKNGSNESSYTGQEAPFLRIYDCSALHHSDGVSEGQFEQVVDAEIAAIQRW